MSAYPTHRAAASLPFSRPRLPAVADENKTGKSDKTDHPDKTDQTHKTGRTLPSVPKHTAGHATRQKSDPHGKRELSLIGDSAAVHRLRLQVNRIGPHFRSVLIRGEAGTEKVQVARTLHALSHKAAGDFIHCSAASLFSLNRPDRPDKTDRPGRSGTPATTEDVPPALTAPRLLRERSLETLAASASGGTLYLEEVDQLSPTAQATLLRILRRHEFAEAGGHIAQRLGCRIIASTSEGLKALASAGRFAQELYQRLAAVEIVVPPLRERTGDLAELIQRALDRLTQPAAAARLTISPEAFEHMRDYSWPGNLQELEAVLESAAARCEAGTIELRHLPPLSSNQTPMAAEQIEANVRLQDVIERHVMLVLKACGGNKLRAAERLGISRSTLYRMLEAGSTSQLLR